MKLYVVCFFIQAEDGIRDTSVTGVQTCALPISQLVFSIAMLRGRRVDFDFRLSLPDR